MIRFIKEQSNSKFDAGVSDSDGTSGRSNALSAPLFRHEYRCFFSNTASSGNCEQYDLDALSCLTARTNFRNQYGWDPFNAKTFEIVTRIESLLKQMNQELPEDSLGHRILSSEAMEKIRNLLIPLCNSIDPDKHSNGITVEGYPVACNAHDLDKKYEDLWNEVIAILSEEILKEDDTAALLVGIKNLLIGILTGQLLKQLLPIFKQMSPGFEKFLESLLGDFGKSIFNEVLKYATKSIEALNDFIDERIRELSEVINDQNQSTLLQTLVNSIIESVPYQDELNKRLCEATSLDIQIITDKAFRDRELGKLCTLEWGINIVDATSRANDLFLSIDNPGDICFAAHDEANALYNFYINECVENS